MNHKQALALGGSSTPFVSTLSRGTEVSPARLLRIAARVAAWAAGTRQRADVEDLGGETALGAFCALELFDPTRGASLRWFLNDRARWAAAATLARWRRNEERLELRADIEELLSTNHAEDNAIHAEERRRASAALRVAIASLWQKDQRLIDLRYVRGLPWEQVAEAFRIPVGTVRRRDQAVRARLRRALVRAGVGSCPVF